MFCKNCRQPIKKQRSSFMSETFVWKDSALYVGAFCPENDGQDHEPVETLEPVTPLPPSVSEFIAYESGDLSSLETLEFFGLLIRSGTIGIFQGHYGRTARLLVDTGLLSPDGNLTDAAIERLAEQPEVDTDPQP